MPPNINETPAKQYARFILAMPHAQRDAAVLQQVNHANPDNRMDSLEIAIEVGYQNIDSLCLALFNDPVWYVRCAACEFSYYHAVSGASVAAIELLKNDGDQTVRAYATLSLMRNGVVDQIEELERIAEIATGVDHEGTPIRDRVNMAIKSIRIRASSAAE